MRKNDNLITLKVFMAVFLHSVVSELYETFLPLGFYGFFFKYKTGSFSVPNFEITRKPGQRLIILIELGTCLVYPIRTGDA